jgi:hypothetical protein
MIEAEAVKKPQQERRRAEQDDRHTRILSYGSAKYAHAPIAADFFDRTA